MKKVLEKLSWLTIRDLTLFFEACFFLSIASVIRIIGPMRWYAPFFGKQVNDMSKKVYPEENSERVKEVITAINRGSRYLPMKCKCLVQAIAGKAMLKVRGIRCSVFFGVARDKEGELLAHAWTKVGERFITGARDVKHFKMISLFTD